MQASTPLNILPTVQAARVEGLTLFLLSMFSLQTFLLSQLQYDNTPSNLYALLKSGSYFHVHVVFLDESAKLGFVVKDVEIVVFKLDEGVVA